jgi:choline dehydrogenase
MTRGNTVDDGEALRTNIVFHCRPILAPDVDCAGNGFRSDGCRPTPGKVRGVEALWVVDASTLPDIPSVATNVTTIVVAERIAAKHISNRHAVPRR